ncbi:hypothetical protein ACF0H5_022082 [Mactra antiquata]
MSSLAEISTGITLCLTVDVGGKLQEGLSQNDSTMIMKFKLFILVAIMVFSIVIQIVSAGVRTSYGPGEDETCKHEDNVYPVGKIFAGSDKKIYKCFAGNIVRRYDFD